MHVARRHRTAGVGRRIGEDLGHRIGTALGGGPGQVGLTHRDVGAEAFRGFGPVGVPLGVAVGLEDRVVGGAVEGPEAPGDGV